MIRMSVTAEGLQPALDSMEAMKAAAREPFSNGGSVGNDCAVTLLRAMRGRAPYRTGQFAESLFSQFRATSTRATITGRTSGASTRGRWTVDNAMLARYIIRGTRPHSIHNLGNTMSLQAFARRKYDVSAGLYAAWRAGGLGARALHWTDGSGEHFATRVFHPGTTANPFAVLAAGDVLDEIERRFTRFTVTRIRDAMQKRR